MASALQQGKSSKPKVDPLRLSTALLVGGTGLSARRLRAVVQLRELMNSLKVGSQGALVKLKPRESVPWLDAEQICIDSPLIADYFSILLNKLSALFPEAQQELAGIQQARRSGLSVHELSSALWNSDDALEVLTRQYSLRPRLTAAILWLAIKPMLEAVAEAFIRHFPIAESHNSCPICAGPAWAFHGDSAKCSLCETTWQSNTPPAIQLLAGVQPTGAKRGFDENSGRQIYLLDAELFETSTDLGVLLSVIQLL